MKTKTCTKCNETKSIDEFQKDKKMKDGHKNQCKECVGKRMKKYKDDPENKRNIKVQRKQYRIENKEELATKNKEWRNNNPGKVKANDQGKRARRRGADIDWNHVEELEEYWISQGIDPCKCFYCSCVLTAKTRQLEHMIPLARGGTSNMDNIVPACQSCNNTKYTMTAEEFINEQTRKEKAVQ